MNLSNLQEQTKVKNYPALCKLLEEPQKNGGDAKKAQLKEWARYFLSERQGNAFLIQKIYAEPLPSEDKRAKYLRHLEPIILSFLADCGGEYETTVRNWSIALGVFSEDAFDEEKRSIYGQEFGIDAFTMRRAVKAAEETFRKALFSALDYLKKRDTIVYEETLYIVMLGGGRHVATNEERRAHDRLKDSIVASLGCKNLWGVYMSKTKSEQFYEQFSAAMRTQYGWEKAYSLLSVSAKKDSFSAYDEVTVQQAIQQLKSEIKNAVIKSARTSEKQNQERCLAAWEEDLSEKIFQLPPFFANSTWLFFTEFMKW